METELKIEPSPEQVEALLDYSLNVGPLAMVPGERAWILNKIKKNNPTAKVLSAHLDTYNVMWIVKVCYTDVQKSV